MKSMLAATLSCFFPVLALAADSSRTILVTGWVTPAGSGLAGEALFDELLVSAARRSVPEDRIVALSDVAELLELEQAKDLVGCDDVTCAAEIGGALDADYILRGAVARVGGEQVVLLKLVDTETPRAARRVSVSVNNSDGLPAAVERLAAWLLQDTNTELRSWVARLAYRGLDCSEAARCLANVRAQLGDVEFLLQQPEWPVVLERYRGAIDARAVSLRLQEKTLTARERARRNAELTQFHEVKTGRVTQRWVTIHREFEGEP